MFYSCTNNLFDFLEDIYFALFYDVEHIFFYVRTNQINMRQLVGMLRRANDIPHLDLSSMNLDRGDLMSILPHMHKVSRSINLGYNRIGSSTCTDLLHSCSCTSIDLTCNNIGIDGAIAIAQTMYKNLVSLNIQNNDVGPMGAEYIAKYGIHLTELNIANNQIHDMGAIAIANNMNKNLTILYVGSNFITSNGAQYLAQNPCIKNLDIRYNQLDSVSFFLPNRILQTIDLWGNLALNNADHILIGKLLEENRIRARIPEWAEKHKPIEQTLSERLPKHVAAEITTMAFFHPGVSKNLFTEATHALVASTAQI